MWIRDVEKWTEAKSLVYTLIEMVNKVQYDRGGVLKLNRNRVREIGKRLHEVGGVGCMATVEHLVYNRVGERREDFVMAVEEIWDGVGKWRQYDSDKEWF